MRGAVGWWGGCSLSGIDVLLQRVSAEHLTVHSRRSTPEPMSARSWRLTRRAATPGMKTIPPPKQFNQVETPIFQRAGAVDRFAQLSQPAGKPWRTGVPSPQDSRPNLVRYILSADATPVPVASRACTERREGHRRHPGEP